MPARVVNVIKGSIAHRAGFKENDVILEINGIPTTDYLDYMFASANDRLEIKLSDRTINLENEDYEPLGLEFETMLIDEPKSCRNKCVFCFIDQLPPNMRSSCYFKDDDYRLSFLQGNYVTLTNFSEADIKRITDYNIPRINISVHTTNPELRCKMLNNRFAGNVLDIMRRLAENQIDMNCQIVLCKNYNDKAELDRTLSDLYELRDSIGSVSIVPVGLSAYRQNLTPLELFSAEESRAVIRQTQVWQEKALSETGRAFVYLGDEFYITAGELIPPYEHYDGFPQIENGVGLVAALEYEFDDFLSQKSKKKIKVKTPKSIATGCLAYEHIRALADKISPNIKVYKIRNDFFGENITVAGLVTGGDIIKQLKCKDLGEKLLIPDSMLRHNDVVFLDDTTIHDVERELGVKVCAVPNDGYVFAEELIK